MPNLSFLKNVELTELHVHVGSAVSALELWEIAQDQGLRLPTKDYWAFHKLIKMSTPEQYEEYLKRFDLTEKIQSSPNAMFEVIQRGIAKAYLKNNITKIELRFNPIYRNQKGSIDLDHIIVYAIHGMERAMLKFPVQAGLVLCLDRRLSNKENAGIVKKAIKYHKRGVVGIDLAGSISANDHARSFQPAQIKEMVADAKAAGLGITIHTGEVTEVNEMWEVIHELKPDRLGHGIACVHDPKLMKYLKEQNIVLETCPSSNLQTKVIANFDQMRQIYRALLNHQVKFTINTDGPEFLDTSLLHEYQLLLANHILTKEEILKANQIASAASFIN